MTLSDRERQLLARLVSGLNALHSHPLSPEELASLRQRLSAPLALEAEDRRPDPPSPPSRLPGHSAPTNLVQSQLSNAKVLLREAASHLANSSRATTPSKCVACAGEYPAESGPIGHKPGCWMLRFATWLNSLSGSGG